MGARQVVLLTSLDATLLNCLPFYKQNAPLTPLESVPASPLLGVANKGLITSLKSTLTGTRGCNPRRCNIYKKHRSGDSLRLPDPPIHQAQSDVPGFVVLDFDHDEAVGRHGRAGFRAILEFVEAIDVRGRELAAANTKQRADHLAHHVAQERTTLYGKDQLLIVRAANEIRGQTGRFLLHLRNSTDGSHRSG